MKIIPNLISFVPVSGSCCGNSERQNPALEKTQCTIQKSIDNLANHICKGAARFWQRIISRKNKKLKK